MKKLIYIVVVAYTIVSCSGTHKEIFKEGLTYENFRGFYPVDPIEYDDKIQIVENSKIVNKEIKLLSSDEILQFLNNETVLVSIGQVTAEGKISYLPITISAKNSSYKVTMDYMKYATLPQADEVGNFIGFNRIGVGLRLITLLTASEAGINIGDLSSIGIAAKAGKVKGTLMIEIVGIKSKEVTTLLPLPSEINQTTIQNAMQALATIKSKIYDDQTKLYPQVMAIKPSSTTSEKTDKSGSVSTEIKEIPTDKNLEDNIKLQIGNKKINVIDSKQAQTREIEAFNLLFEKKIDEAIVKFDESESAYPGFHSVFDISNLLKSEKPNLSNPNSPKWKEIYAKILDEFSWKIPNSIIEKLNKEINK